MSPLLVPFWTLTCNESADEHGFRVFHLWITGSHPNIKHGLAKITVSDGLCLRGDDKHFEIPDFVLALAKVPELIAALGDIVDSAHPDDVRYARARALLASCPARNMEVLE